MTRRTRPRAFARATTSLSHAYRADHADESTQRQYAGWLGLVRDRAPAGGDVLDLGCGSDIPAAKWLTDNGFRVAGVDLSDTMLERARELVPGATVLRGDVALVREVDFDVASLDAVVSFYALIHIPLADDETFVPEGTGGHRLFVATRND